MSDKGFWIIIVAIIAVFIGIVAYSKSTAPPSIVSDGSNNIYGRADSTVTLTEFVDFQCEACYAYYPTVKEVKEKYKDTVKFQVRHFPIASSHKFAQMAATYAEAAAKQDRFWEMHDKIFEGQKQWERMADPSTVFDGYGEEIGLDMSELETDRTSAEVKAAINADFKAAQEAGGQGTPTFVLNGKKVERVENSVEAFSKLLDDALAQTAEN